MGKADDLRIRLAVLSDTLSKGSAKWKSMTHKQRVNHYSTYTGVKPQHVDLTGMTYSMLPKYVKKSLNDDINDNI